MNNRSITTLLFLSAFLFITFNADAQYKRKGSKRTQKSEFNLQDRLWYGGNLILGFSNNVFNIGVTPMVGYKFNDMFSAGPKFKIDYYYEKIFFTNGTSDNFDAVTWGIGGFSRAKFFRNFLLHVEYEYENVALPAIDSGEIVTIRDPRNNFYVGGGYNSGDLWGYEILVLYNVLEPENSNRIPWDIRFGITYNF